MKHLAVMNVVGLTPRMLGNNTPHLNALVKTGHMSSLAAIFPAVTTTAQACMLTGKTPDEHGIVGNGWYFKELAEVGFWKQNNGLIQAPKVWDVLKAQHPNIKVSKLFWWYNMYANVDHSITPRPHYLADGGKIFDLYSSPKGLHQKIEAQIGSFPFFSFWGPKAGIESSQWIAQAAMEEFKLNAPHLQLVYLPHLDYSLQTLGPKHPSIAHAVQAIDKVCGELIDFYRAHNVAVVVVSEYGISEVNHAIHINRILREHGYLQVRDTKGDKWPEGFETLDCGASKAFAVADHQCAHIYVNDASCINSIEHLLQQVDGIEQVFRKNDATQYHLNHERAGDLVAIARADAWFTYYYWLDDKRAPDFARTVDIHRKPGYDPAEMFLNPSITFPSLKILGKLIRKKLGQRVLMDLIPLDASLIKGSHGRLTDDPLDGPIIICPSDLAQDNYNMQDIFQLILRYYKTQTRRS